MSKFAPKSTGGVDAALDFNCNEGSRFLVLYTTSNNGLKSEFPLRDPMRPRQRRGYALVVWRVGDAGPFLNLTDRSRGCTISTDKRMTTKERRRRGEEEIMGIGINVSWTDPG